MSLRFPCSRCIWPEVFVPRTEMAKHCPKITELKNLKNASVARCVSQNVSQGHEFLSMGKCHLAPGDGHTVPPDMCVSALIRWHPDPDSLVLFAALSWLPSALHEPLG